MGACELRAVDGLEARLERGDQGDPGGRARGGGEARPPVAGGSLQVCGGNADAIGVAWRIVPFELAEHVRLPLVERARATVERGRRGEAGLLSPLCGNLRDELVDDLLRLLRALLLRLCQEGGELLGVEASDRGCGGRCGGGGDRGGDGGIHLLLQRGVLLLQCLLHDLIHGGGIHGGERRGSGVEATRTVGWRVCEASAWGPDLLDPKPSATGVCLSDEVCRMRWRVCVLKTKSDKRAVEARWGGDLGTAGKFPAAPKWLAPN